MKKLLFFGLTLALTTSHLETQAKWKQYNLGNQKIIKLAAGGNQLWAIISEKTTYLEKTINRYLEIEEYFLAQWDTVNKKFNKKINVGPKPRDLSAAPDGSVYVLKSDGPAKFVGNTLQTIFNPYPRILNSCVAFNQNRIVAAFFLFHKEKGPGRKPSKFIGSSVEIWNGSSFKKLGQNVNARLNLKAGIDGSLYAIGSTTVTESTQPGTFSTKDVHVMFAWNGTSWAPTNLGLPKGFEIRNIAPINAKNIWAVAYHSPTRRYHIMHWNGTKTTSKGPGYGTLIAAALTGVFVAKGNTLYQLTK